MQWGLVLLLVGATASLQAATGPAKGVWDAAWTASLQKQTAAAPLSDVTVRQRVRLGIGGSQVRVRLSNEFGDEPLRIDRSSIALTDPSGALKPATLRALSFAGSPDVEIPPGAVMLSDPIALNARERDTVAISLYLRKSSTALSYQRQAATGASELSMPGDFTAAAEMPVKEKGFRLFLSAVEVQRDRHVPVVVIFSDTKSAGPETWADMASEKLAGRVSVVNRSIFAGAVVMAGNGENGLARFDRDVLATSGASDVLIFLGNNDVIWPGMTIGGKLVDPASALSVRQMTGILQQLIDRAHSRGLRAWGATFLPYKDASAPGYARPESLQKRDEINEWIRHSKAFDAVVDFDAALRDPADAQRLLPAFDSGNHFTPNAAGYQRMAEVFTKAFERR